MLRSGVGRSGVAILPDLYGRWWIWRVTIIDRGMGRNRSKRDSYKSAR